MSHASTEGDLFMMKRSNLEWEDNMQNFICSVDGHDSDTHLILLQEKMQYESKAHSLPIHLQHSLSNLLRKPPRFASEDLEEGEAPASQAKDESRSAESWGGPATVAKGEHKDGADEEPPKATKADVGRGGLFLADPLASTEGDLFIMKRSSLEWEGNDTDNQSRNLQLVNAKCVERDHMTAMKSLHKHSLAMHQLSCTNKSCS